MKKIKYCINHDDMLLIKEQHKEPGPNIRLAVYLDICRDAARLYEIFGDRTRKRIINHKWSCEDWLRFEPIGEGTRVFFYYDPRDVIAEWNLRGEDVFEALKWLSANAIIHFCHKPVHGTYKMMLPEIRLATRLPEKVQVEA